MSYGGLYDIGMNTTIECARAECETIFVPRWKNQRYCGSSCAAKVNNSRVHKRVRTTHKCQRCGGPVSSSITIHCVLCYKITQQEEKQLRIESWLSGEWRGGTDAGLSNTIREYLLLKENYKCVKCGFNERHPDDNSCILEINHINGNGTDHRPGNLEVLCPNHHALTSSYRGRNHGNGRPVSYLRRVRATGFEPA